MNIKQAKEEIIHTVQAYLSKDENGVYKIPSIRQRPVLLMGPPGIGKTQIMEQIARECKIGLVSYTITHHTRQSAVGLPFIKEEVFDGKTYSVTEYTMSEIIASIYRTIKESGNREGILFIDEINCVSETLAPTMLQFLQCKTFGNQKIPEGWIIVAAGNPPEYNKSVRDFDMVTLDRVRYMQIEADLSVWREYANAKHISQCILSYLELHPGSFYRVQADVDGMQFVTARGWEDLSNLLDTYESLEIPVGQELIAEFLHHTDVAEDFFAYYDLYQKYRDDYGITEILKGHQPPELFARIDQAAFDERICVVNLILEGLQNGFAKIRSSKELADAWFAFLKQYRNGLEQVEDPKARYLELSEERKNWVVTQEKAGFFTRKQAAVQQKLLKRILEYIPQAKEANECFLQAKAGFDKHCAAMEQEWQQSSTELEHAFDFMERAFEHGQELVVFVTELTMNPDSAMFLANHSCERYLKYREEFLTDRKRAEILNELEMDRNVNKS
ncbi:MAG: AAA family ATPase [Lachnospiraceae bacterium]|nr:AAA family ATPase [Lachnospiraceae bacterium]